MKIHIRNIPKAIMDYYKLWGLVYKDHVYVRITKGMYGLPQAGRLANDQLIKFLTAAGYSQSRLVPGLFTHDTRPIQFCLVVDDFLVKYTEEEHAQHFIATLKQHYTITVDMEAKQYLGLQLDWNYKERYVDVSMPGYVDKALARFQHPAPRKQQHSPFPWTQPTYGAKTQYTADEDLSTPLTAPEVKKLQQVIGTFLYYARAIDCTMLVALGSLAAQQTTATQKNHVPPQPLHGLRILQPPRDNQISRERHGPPHPFRCVIPFRIQRTIPCRWHFLSLFKTCPQHAP